MRMAPARRSRSTNSPAMGSRGALRDSRGTLPCPSVLSCARRSQRPSGHTGFRSTRRQPNQAVTNSALLPRFAAAPPGRPYKANVGRFEPDSTHHDLLRAHFPASFLLSGCRMQRLNLRFRLLPHEPEIVLRLKVDPDLRLNAEDPRKPHRHIRRPACVAAL